VVLSRSNDSEERGHNRIAFLFSSFDYFSSHNPRTLDENCTENGDEDDDEDDDDEDQHPFQEVHGAGDDDDHNFQDGENGPAEDEVERLLKELAEDEAKLEQYVPLCVNEFPTATVTVGHVLFVCADINLDHTKKEEAKKRMDSWKLQRHTRGIQELPADDAHLLPTTSAAATEAAVEKAVEEKAEDDDYDDEDDEYLKMKSESPAAKTEHWMVATKVD